jgi:hypothetical protein
MLFVVKSRDCFVPNSECHGFNTRQTGNLHLSQVNLTVYRKGEYHSAVKIFNSLPLKLKENSDNPKKIQIHGDRISLFTLLLYTGAIL